MIKKKFKYQNIFKQMMMVCAFAVISFGVSNKALFATSGSSDGSNGTLTVDSPNMGGGGGNSIDDVYNAVIDSRNDASNRFNNIDQAIAGLSQRVGDFEGRFNQRIVDFEARINQRIDLRFQELNTSVTNTINTAFTNNQAFFESFRSDITALAVTISVLSARLAQLNTTLGDKLDVISPDITKLLEQIKQKMDTLVTGELVLGGRIQNIDLNIQQFGQGNQAIAENLRDLSDVSSALMGQLGLLLNKQGINMPQISTYRDDKGVVRIEVREQSSQGSDDASSDEGHAYQLPSEILASAEKLKGSSKKK